MSRTISRINRSRPPPMYILAPFSRVRRSGVRVMYPTLPLLTPQRSPWGPGRQRGEGRLHRPEAVRQHGLMRAGGLEPPRERPPNGTQTRRVCQFRHARRRLEDRSAGVGKAHDGPGRPRTREPRKRHHEVRGDPPRRGGRARGPLGASPGRTAPREERAVDRGGAAGGRTPRPERVPRRPRSGLRMRARLSGRVAARLCGPDDPRQRPDPPLLRRLGHAPSYVATVTALFTGFTPVSRPTSAHDREAGRYGPGWSRTIARRFEVCRSIH